ncbi:MAG: hypothetical protein U9Q15_02115 [Patescibacteria group bacterium]|nr:hypothetical protein [Patescibacteria group bacterium]
MFTEALDLQCLNGTMLCFAYPDTVRHETHWPQQPFQIFVEQGIVVGHNGPQEFQDLLDVIRTEDVEDRVWVREFGLGLNRNVTGRLNDVSSYERREGIHFSLGLKHNIYRKKFGKKVLQRFHIDIFIDAQEVVVDDTVLFQKEE